MNKRAALLIILFLAFPYIVHSAATFTVQETEKISLQADAADPDADRLTTTYAYPLNDNGEWQTKYGDAGEYKSKVTVSDGITNDSRDILIIVKKKEESPKIESFIPNQDSLSINEGQASDFRVMASDLNNDELKYEWLVDGKKSKEGTEFSYNTGYNDAGAHKILAVVSDGTTDTSKEWAVNVENVDVEGMLNGINDIVVNENDIARLKLPDFEKYGLAYSISEPIGSKNEWKTSYNDAGSYEAKVHAEGKGFSGDKTVKVAVNDVDRAPVFDRIENKVLNENEEMKITLNANDPDGDEITYSASGLPEGSKFEGNVFTWKIGYDAVRKNGFVDKVLDNFRVLSRSFYLQFAASSKGKKAVQNVVITVRDANRAPVLEDIEPITINEGESLKISPKAYDPDGDKVSLSYSGFTGKDAYKSNFGDAGAYYVKVTASDGLLETSKFAQINIRHVNRATAFGKINNIRAMEGDSIAVLLDAQDPDGDEITYSIDNPPEGSSLKGNVFLWVPGYNTANKKETKEFNLVFAASDGKSQARQIAKIEVTGKNRAPKIIDATKSISARVNEPVLMSVKASDEDGDELSYTWNFGLLESYKATASHQRTFTSRGLKTARVIVSDGTDEAEQLISVNVV